METMNVWVRTKINDCVLPMYRCNHCKGLNNNPTPYCPWCGWKMGCAVTNTNEVRDVLNNCEKDIIKIKELFEDSFSYDDNFTADICLDLI